MIWNKENNGTKLRNPVPNAFQIRSKFLNWNWISGHVDQKAISGANQMVTGKYLGTVIYFLLGDSVQQHTYKIRTDVI
jgi:hypothetical protein